MCFTLRTHSYYIYGTFVLSPSLSSSFALYFSLSTRALPRLSLAAATCDRCNDGDIVVGWSGGGAAEEPQQEVEEVSRLGGCEELEKARKGQLEQQKEEKEEKKKPVRGEREGSDQGRRKGVEEKEEGEEKEEEEEEAEEEEAAAAPVLLAKGRLFSSDTSWRRPSSSPVQP